MTNSRNELKVGKLNQIIWFRIISALENKYQIGDESDYLKENFWAKSENVFFITIHCIKLYLLRKHLIHLRDAFWLPLLAREQRECFKIYKIIAEIAIESID